MKKIKPGDQLPIFSLKDQNGTVAHSKDWLGAPVVVYFYPNDDTRICTEQACSFRDQYDDFLKLDARVVGISHNNVDSHQAFSKRHQLPFLILSDADNKIRDRFGVPRQLLGLSQGRVTYVFDSKGRLFYMHNSAFGAEEHVSKALKELKNFVL